MVDKAVRGIVRGAAVALALVAAVGAGGCSLMTPALDEAEPAVVDQQVDDSQLVTPGTLTVAVDTSDAPQAMVNQGVTQGYAVDVAAALAEHLGLDLAVVDGSSPSDVLGSRTADVLIGATSSQEDDAVSVVGDYLENATAVFTTAGDSDAVATADELNGAVIGVQASSASQEALVRTGITGEQKTYSNVNECFEALASGEVDYVVSDATAGAYLARAYPGVHFAGVLSQATVLGVAVPTAMPDLAEAVSTTLDDLSGDGTLAAVHAVWYGSLPMSLSDQVVSGVTITDSSDGSNGAASEEEAVGESLNELSQ